MRCINRVFILLDISCFRSIIGPPALNLDVGVGIGFTPCFEVNTGNQYCVGDWI